MTKLISRDDAITECLRFYFTGKPCRAGHISKRYTTGGSCVECHVATKTKYKNKTTMARRRHNMQKAQDNFTFILSIPDDWQECFEQLQDIAIRTNEDQKVRIQTLITAMHVETRRKFTMPQQPMRSVRTVNKADIMRVIVWEHNEVQNEPDLEIRPQTDTVPHLVKIGPDWYVASKVLRCLHGFEQLVSPYNPAVDILIP